MRNVLIVVSILLLGGGIFWYTHRLQTQMGGSISMPSVTIAPSIPAAQRASYHDQYLSFQYPASWSPKSQEAAMGYELEVIQLNIPGVTSDESAGFSSLPLEKVTPNDVVRTESKTIGDREWIKWVREGAGYVSYDYYTKNPFSSGTFSIQVTKESEDQSLEHELDALIQTVQFSQ